MSSLTLAKLLLLDEPFSAVDPLTRLELYEVVEKLNGQMKRSVLWIRTISVRRSDWIMVVLQDGILLQNDPISNVIGNPAPHVERLIQSAT